MNTTQFVGQVLGIPLQLGLVVNFCVYFRNRFTFRKWFYKAVYFGCIDHELIIPMWPKLKSGSNTRLMLMKYISSQLSCSFYFNEQLVWKSIICMVGY